MLFPSQVFLAFFLPLTLFIYYLLKNRTLKNNWLIITSLFFYWYGAKEILALLVISIIVNWGIALVIAKITVIHQKKLVLLLDICFNLGYLGYFKYYDFFADNINFIFGTSIALKNIALPIGISFFTFQALSYCMDVYRNSSLVQKNPLNVALYISFFPQLIAGPIVRFSTIEKQISERTESIQKFNEGVIRFTYGLGKKVIFANVIAVFVDDIFAMPHDERSILVSWIGAVGYTLQIYYDFSGYSDMAIGLGKMFGFNFMENFNFPYYAKSVSEFWRRWHISLSQWFRDYVYIPLGGNRVKKHRLFINLLIVWLLTGIWHGANWTFILWGVIYGILIVMEKLVDFENRNIPTIIKRIYTLISVIILWVIFRADSLTDGFYYLRGMAGLNHNVLLDDMGIFYIKENIVVFLCATVLSFPVLSALKERFNLDKYMDYIRPWGICAILILSLSYIVKGSYNPFIYFNF